MTSLRVKLLVLPQHSSASTAKNWLSTNSGNKINLIKFHILMIRLSTTICINLCCFGCKWGQHQWFLWSPCMAQLRFAKFWIFIPQFLTGAKHVGNEGMTHNNYYDNSPSNPQQPIHSLPVQRTSKIFPPKLHIDLPRPEKLVLSPAGHSFGNGPVCKGLPYTFGKIPTNQQSLFSVSNPNQSKSSILDWDVPLISINYQPSILG